MATKQKAKRSRTTKYKPRRTPDANVISDLLRECNERNVPQIERYVLLHEAGLSKVQAKRAAGYAEGTTSTDLDRTARNQRVVETVQEARDRLQQTAGYRIDDQAEWYRRKRDRADSEDTQIKAAARLDRILGYDAPQQVEISERREIAVAVQLLGRLDAAGPDIRQQLSGATVQQVGVQSGE